MKKRRRRIVAAKRPNHDQLVLHRLIYRLRDWIPPEDILRVVAWILDDHEHSRLSKIVELAVRYNRNPSPAARKAFVEEVLSLGKDLRKESA